jgi:hypothetical protein
MLKNECCLYVIISIRFFSITICNLLIEFPSYNEKWDITGCEAGLKSCAMRRCVVGWVAPMFERIVVPSSSRVSAVKEDTKLVNQRIKRQEIKRMMEDGRTLERRSWERCSEVKAWYSISYLLVALFCAIADMGMEMGPLPNCVVMENRTNSQAATAVMSVFKC